MKFTFVAFMALNALVTTAAVANGLEISDSTNISESSPNGRMQITAEKNEYSKKLKTFVASGNVQVVIGAQNSKLEADKVVYDQTTEIIDAQGHVRIMRNGQLTEGSAFRFRIDSDEYLVTAPGTTVTDPTGLVVHASPNERHSATLPFPQPTPKLNHKSPGSYGAGTRHGDFGSNKLFFVPGAGLSKHPEPNPK